MHILAAVSVTRLDGAIFKSSWQRIFFFFKWPFPASFALFSSFHYSWQYTNVLYKLCQWLDSNHGPLVLEATDLPTEPQPLATYFLANVAQFVGDFCRYFKHHCFCLQTTAKGPGKYLICCCCCCCCCGHFVNLLLGVHFWFRSGRRPRTRPGLD